MDFARKLGIGIVMIIPTYLPPLQKAASVYIKGTPYQN